MRICITSEGESIDSKIDPRFGRCRYFIIADTDTLEFEVIKNPNINSVGGAGIQSAQLVASKKVKAVLSGNVGPNAFRVLNAEGIDVYTQITGSVKEAIEAYKSGRLKKAESSNVGSKFGMGG
ncbi:MAG: dinitrogenase iron-molybdenum cofactor biosynthesis protein [Candidatus Omnitrophota bacterium]|nr:MAG: dinitrogenase iron-molybdenum cofactor biosynthesis protein [Candidatus Omnitrophota bacterium]